MKTVRSRLPQGADPAACTATMPKFGRTDAKALAGRKPGRPKARSEAALGAEEAAAVAGRVDGMHHAGPSLQARVRLHV
jgi:hypothetical protein